MELSFKDLKNRDVINITDGKCLGRITDLTISFPRAVLIGITVPGSRKNWFLQLFDRNKFYIEERKILKIGNDVILVDINCGEVCEPNVNVNKPKPQRPSSPCGTCEELFGQNTNNRIDTDDY